MGAKEQDRTVHDVLRAAIQELEAAKVDEAAESVYHILSKVLDLSWDTGFRELRDVHNQSNAPCTRLASQRLSTQQRATLQALLERRKQHEPIQYLMGQWDFMDHVFAIVPPLLCPRPETEELVLLAAANRDSTTNTRILDVGCGTGCIGISLAHRLPAAHVTALDIEPQAIVTARQNAASILGDNHAAVRYQVHLCAAQDFHLHNNSSSKDRFDLVISNPPYIPVRYMESLDAVVSQWESHQALCGGIDGLDVIRTIVHQLPYWCRKGADCWMEVDPTHPAMLQEILETNEHVAFVASHRDLQGLDRFVHLRVLREKEAERMIKNNLDEYEQL